MRCMKNQQAYYEKANDVFMKHLRRNKKLLCEYTIYLDITHNNGIKLVKKN